MEAAWRYMATKRTQGEKNTLEAGNLFSPAVVSGIDNFSLPSVTNIAGQGGRNGGGFHTQLGSTR